MTLRVVAHMQAKSDKVGEAREALQGLIAPTHQEPGCISYEMLQSIEDPAQFTFVEEWQDEASLDAHFATDHIKAALEHWDDLMDGGLDLRKYSKAG